MITVGVAIYAACVDFMIQLARLGGATYRDANAFFFFVLWPLVTLGLAAFYVVERVRFHRAQRRRS